MKLYKISVDLGNPTDSSITVGNGEDFILAVKAVEKGVTKTITVENDDDECLIDCDYELEGYVTYKLNLTQTNRYHIHFGTRQIAYIVVNVKDVNCIDVDYSSCQPEKDEEKPRVVFKDWLSAIPAYFDGSDSPTYILPGCQTECSAMTFIGFAVTQPLSGNSVGTQLSDMTLNQAGMQISADTLVVKHQTGYTLWNECGQAINILKNRVSNVRLNNDGYSINVACFKPDEMIAVRNATVSCFVLAGQEFWLSSNYTIYNPFE